jgi:hypothetical protein
MGGSGGVNGGSAVPAGAEVSVVSLGKQSPTSVTSPDPSGGGRQLGYALTPVLEAGVRWHSGNDPMGQNVGMKVAAGRLRFRSLSFGRGSRPPGRHS